MTDPCDMLDAGEAQAEAEVVQAVLDGLPEIAHLYDHGWRWRHLNPAAAAWVESRGRDPRRLIGRCVWDEFPELRGTPVQAAALRADEERREAIVEASWEGRDYETRIIPYRHGIVGLTRDVTELRSGEASRRRLAAIVESSQDAIIGQDLEGTVTSWNRAAERMYGYAAEEIVGRPISLLVPPELPDDVPGIMERLRRGERVKQYETIRRTKEGRNVHVSLTISPIRDERGAIVGASTIARDVTERVAYESRQQLLLDQLRERQAELARARDEAEREVARTAVLQSATAALAQAVDPGEIAEALIRAGGGALGASGGALVLREADGRSTSIRYMVEVPEEVAREWRQRTASEGRTSPSLDVLAEGKPLYLRSREEHVRRYPHLAELLARTGAAAGAFLPLVSGADVIGALALRFPSERGFPAEERALLETLAQLGSQALERARLFEAEAEARRRAEEAGARARQLAEASRVLASSLEYERTIAHVVRIAVEALGDFGGVDLLREDGRMVRMATWDRDPGKREMAEALEAYPPDLGREHGAARALRTGEPVVGNDVSDEVLLAIARDREHLALLRALEIRSFVIVPLVARGQTLGSIAVGSRDPDRYYDEEDVAFARELATRAAVAIDNARLHRRAEEAARSREEALAIVSHDLKNPLAVVLNSARALRDYEPPGEKREELLERQIRAVERADRLVDDLLEVARSEAGRLNLELTPTRLGELAAEAVELHREEARRKGLELVHEVSDSLPWIRVDRDRMLRVLSNLVSNAIKFTSPGGRIVVAAARTEAGVRLRVTDSGLGIRDEERTRLFERFWQAKRSGRAGTGLGLAICKGFVEAHEGRIEVDSEPGVGTTFAVTLPVEREEAAGT